MPHQLIAEIDPEKQLIAFYEGGRWYPALLSDDARDRGKPPVQLYIREDTRRNTPIFVESYRFLDELKRQMKRKEKRRLGEKRVLADEYYAQLGRLRLARVLRGGE